MPPYIGSTPPQITHRVSDGGSLDGSNGSAESVEAVAVRFSVAASVRFPGAGVGVGVGDGEGFGLRHGGVLGEFGGEGAANEVYASSPSRPACALSRPTAYSCFDVLNGTMVPDGSLRQSDCPVELSSLR